ncbi:sterol desaturase family protein [Arenibacter sp. GZD96]|uniref:sterol desaturase family protein n=1 Tax=Aurantibrevibacter litoralis TaxID=3106030 RepID=UPI002B00244F|nr:sterol desaturase family protein [Arenibacter sp. GZD-96]MEA1786859.1 sterol desaturase family protein [Arenibacter sp. GZD-96]
METYATALLYAIPFFIALLLLEILYGHFVKRQTHTVLDTVASISSGLTNVIKDSLGLAVILVSYPFLVSHVAIFNIETTWLVWVLGFVILDFAGYWNHRLSHQINIFWNQHVIHHSSEEFNLACALRQPISNLLGYFSILLLPAAVLGVPNSVVAILAPVHLFAQFWYHTQHIGKLGWLEYFIVTPSQHRVHHAINPEYIDKNLGQIFCVWDRIFGTFQEELDAVKPQFGVLKPAGTWNPVVINFQHLWRLLKDAWHTKNFWDKWRIWFMPTGWRPADIQDKFPISVITDVYHFKKYATPWSSFFKVYIVGQLLANLCFMLFLFYNFEHIGSSNSLIYGIFILLSVFSYTALMDQHRYAIWSELFRALAGVFFIIVSGNWFGINVLFVSGDRWVLLYFVTTILGSVYFGFWELTKRKEVVSV